MGQAVNSTLTWMAAMVLATVALTLLVAAPIVWKVSTAYAEHRAEREVMQAVLWAENPLEVLAFFGQFYLDRPKRGVPRPPELDPADYHDDEGEPDPALEQRTRRPLRMVRPATPPAEVDVEPDAAGGSGSGPVTIPIAPNAGHTSHRRMRRPVVGVLDEWLTAIRRVGQACAARFRDARYIAAWKAEAEEGALHHPTAPGLPPGAPRGDTRESPTEGATVVKCKCGNPVQEGKTVCAECLSEIDDDTRLNRLADV